MNTKKIYYDIFKKNDSKFFNINKIDRKNILIDNSYNYTYMFYVFNVQYQQIINVYEQPKLNNNLSVLSHYYIRKEYNKEGIKIQFINILNNKVDKKRFFILNTSNNLLFLCNEHLLIYYKPFNMMETIQFK